MLRNDIYTIYNKIFSLVRREIFNLSNYKTSTLIGICVPIVTFLLIAKIAFLNYEIRFGEFMLTNYFFFVISGIIISMYLMAPVSYMKEQVRHERNTGIFEAILVTPTNYLTVLFSIYLWNFLRVFIFTLPFLIFGIIYLKIFLSFLDTILILAVLLSSLATFFGIGIILSALTIIFEETENLTSIINNSFRIFSGVYIPVNYLSLWMQEVSKWLPLTYSIRSIRSIIFHSYSPLSIVKDISILILFMFIIWIIGVSLLNFSIKRAKIKGLLTYY